MNMDQTVFGAIPFAGQVAVITGAGQGIGRETARLLARLGAAVVIAEIGNTGRVVEQEILAEGGRALFLQTDVSDPAGMERLCGIAHSAFGAVTILVNNAEAYVAKPLLEHSLPEWDRVLAVNLRGAYLGIKQFLPDMLSQKHGVIVTMESADGMPYISAYAASKVGLRSLAMSLAAEMPEDSGVSVFCFGPGIVDTPGARSAFRQLAPHYGMTEEEFIAKSGMPFISAELCAVGLVGTILHASDFHGQETAYAAGLAKLGLNASGERVTTENAQPASKPTFSDDTSHGHSGAQVIALNRALEDILQASMAEYDRLPLFVRPVARRMFQQNTGLRVQDWFAHAQEMTRALERGAVDPAGLANYRGQVTRLAGFMLKQQADARGWIKDPADLALALETLESRKNTILELAHALEEMETNTSVAA